MELTDRERTEKLAERLSKRDDEIYPGRRFDAGLYRPNSDHLSQLGPTPAVDPTSDQRERERSLPAAPAMWNMKLQKASTVSTVGGGECHIHCFFIIRHRSYTSCVIALIRCKFTRRCMYEMINAQLNLVQSYFI